MTPPPPRSAEPAAPYLHRRPHNRRRLTAPGVAAQRIYGPEAAAAPREQTVEPARTAVRVGEYAAAPWVDQEGGPRGSGYIMEARDLPGIRSKDQSRMNLYDRLVLAPPVGAVAPEHQLYLSYRLGPLIEGFGQIVIPDRRDRDRAFAAQRRSGSRSRREDVRRGLTESAADRVRQQRGDRSVAGRCR